MKFVLFSRRRKSMLVTGPRYYSFGIIFQAFLHATIYRRFRDRGEHCRACLFDLRTIDWLHVNAYFLLCVGLARCGVVARTWKLKNGRNEEMVSRSECVGIRERQTEN